MDATRAWWNYRMTRLFGIIEYGRRIGETGPDDNWATGITRLLILRNRWSYGKCSHFGREILYFECAPNCIGRSILNVSAELSWNVFVVVENVSSETRTSRWRRLSRSSAFFKIESYFFFYALFVKLEC